MDNIKDIVRQVVQNLSSNNLESHSKLERIWQNILERSQLKHTILVGMKEGKLLVNVDSPAWLFEMKIKKRKILERLQSEIPEIKNIYFRIGKVK